MIKKERSSHAARCMAMRGMAHHDTGRRDGNGGHGAGRGAGWRRRCVQVLLVVPLAWGVLAWGALAGQAEAAKLPVGPIVRLFSRIHLPRAGMVAREGEAAGGAARATARATRAEKGRESWHPPASATGSTQHPLWRGICRDEQGNRKNCQLP